MWANINHFVQKVPKLRLFAAALLVASLIGPLTETAFAATIQGVWQKNGTIISVKTSDNKEFFNPAQENGRWFVQENADGGINGAIKCQTRIYFSGDPTKSAAAAASGTEEFRVERTQGTGQTVCETDASKTNQVTITGSAVIGTPGGSQPTPLPGGSTGGTGNGSGTGDGATATPRCDVGGLSFAICPLINFMADATEWTAHTLQSILYIQPLPLTGTNDLHTAWASILTIANIMLALAFLFVIYSQATNTALSSYGVKKMLPRIIIAAVLMNLSYYVCALLVDLSNLAGVGISGFFAGVLNGSVFTNPQATLSNSFGGSKITEVAAGAGVGAILIFFFLVPVLLAALAVLFTLAARIAIIVLLVMVAPLAFAAWILPNTEKYFKKWYELFFNMLMIFPLIMGTFAAAAVASQLIQSATIQQVQVQGAPADFAQKVLLPLIALLVQALPLFALPFLFKTAGGVLGRIHNMTSSRANQGYNATKNAYQNSEFGKYRGMKKREDQRAMMAGNYRATKNPATWARAGRSRINQALNQNAAFNKATRGYGGYRVLGEGRARSEDQETTAKYIGDDYTLAYAWARSGGSLETALREGHLNRSPAHAAYREKFQEMERAGLGKKADSYIAATKIAAASGYGDMGMLRDAQDSIERTQSNRQQAIKDIADLEHGMAVPTWRSKGRGDIVGWEQVDAANTSRHAFGGPQGAQHVTELGTYLQNNPEKLREFAAKYDSIEARAKPFVEQAIAQATNGQTVDEVRGQFGLRQATIPPGAAGPQGPQGPIGGNGGGGTPTGGGQGPQGPAGPAGGGTTIFSGGFPTGGASGGGAAATPAQSAAPQSTAPTQNLGNQTFTGSAPAAQPQVVQQQVNVEQQAPRATADFTVGSLRASSPETINTVIRTAGGSQNLSDGDITRIAAAAQDRPELANIHDEMLRERRRRTNEAQGRSESGAIITPPGGFQGETSISHNDDRS